jgi:rSAM/selenodomain-associated transferase 1
MKKEVVLVFQKNEVLGKVKTRLASGMGELRALEIYRHLVQMTYSALAEVPASIWTYFSDFIPETVNSPIAKSFAQEGQDLGDRMAGAFARSFELGMDKVVLIGTDCPTLQSQHLNEAFEALTHSDLVLGPATDGGYYLIGMKRRADYLFEGISWSTSQVLTETLNVASQHGLTTTLLQELNDIDTSEDWERYTNQIQITSQLKII